MADTEIASFLNRMGYMLVAEVDSLQEVEDGLWSLHCMFKRLTPFIMEVERKKRKGITKDSKKIREIITLVHEAEDVTDSYLNNKRKGNYSSSMIDEATKFRSRIKGLMERVKESLVWFHKFTETTSTSGTSSSSKRPAPTIEDGGDDAVVVLEDEVERMIDLLKDEEDTRRDIVPVVGPKGIGKTTFVRKVYNDPTIVEHFPCRSWINVSNDYKVEELLQDIMKQIMKPTTAATAADNNDDDEIQEMSNLKDMVIQIYNHLRNPTCRYLVVFDDVCKTQFWDDINMVFPANNKCGSSIIFTSRHDEVASHVRPSKPLCYLRRLSKEESRALFSKRVISLVDSKSQIESNDHLHPSPWQEWVDACGGLPFAIVALAIEYDHHRRLVSISSDDDNKKEEDNESDSDNRLPLVICELIYNALPCHLKMCNLTYWDILKKGYLFFDYKALIVTEGLVKPPPSSVKKIQSRDQTSSSSIAIAVVEEEPEDIAEEYLNELINMNLIKVQSRGFDRRIKEITIPQEYYSLSDQLCKSHEAAAGSKMILEVCSLFNYSSETATLPDLERILQDSVSLRVLNLMKPTPDHCPRTINLIHLRYLRLHFKSLYENDKDFTICLSDLWNLQFLKITFHHDRRQLELPLPLQFWKMRQLRHLLLHGASLDPAFITEKEVNSAIDRQRMLLKNLQTLEGLDAEFCVKEDVLYMMPNLIALLLKGKIYQFDDQLARGFLILERLRKLKLDGNFEPDDVSCKLKIFPPNITHLTLQYTYIHVEYLMRALRKLHNLHVLKLGFGSIREGDDLDFGSDVDDGFHQLKFLKIKKLYKLKKWILSMGIVANLQKVTIRHCPH